MAFAIPAGLSTFLTIAGTAAAIGGAVISTSAQLQANKYQQQVAQRNAALMEENAQRAGFAAQVAQQDQDRAARALLGEQVAAQSASGLKLGGRSQMLTRKSAREIARLDALNIRQAGDIEVYNYKQMAQDKFDELKFLKQQSGSILMSGFLDVASAGISGISRLPQSQLNGLFGARKTSLVASGAKYASSNISTGLRFAR